MEERLQRWWGGHSGLEGHPHVSGFRTPEIPRAQLVLWEQRLEDALPPDHALRLLDVRRRSRAFAATFKEWEAEYDLTEGQPPYHPRDLAALYIYGTRSRLRSSRQQEAACYNRLDILWLLSGQPPDHAAIAGFVKRHPQRLRHIYRDVLKVAVAAGLRKLQHVACDRTKIGADAGKGSVQGQAEVEAELHTLDARLEALERAWQENEQREQALWGHELARPPRLCPNAWRRCGSGQNACSRRWRILSGGRRRARRPRNPRRLHRARRRWNGASGCSNTCWACGASCGAAWKPCGRSGC
jgi:transposase